MDEANNWGLDIKELKRAIDESRSKCNPRAIVIINPGNPTGSINSFYSSFLCIVESLNCGNFNSTDCWKESAVRTTL
jgi:bifunctional pyridoxal-dependent enzyme with beta-cystathionase and maltose regulon repressor activities